MPRTYIRKKERTYTLETLKQAVREIREKKLSFRQAQVKYNIPRATLFDRVKKDNIRDPKKGKKPTFNDSQEDELVEFILKCCKIFYGITITTLRKAAFDFATAKGLKHNFKQDTRLAGMDWYYSFIARHPNIVLRRTEEPNISRISSEDTDIFFNYLNQLISKHSFKSDAIYYLDEMGISSKHGTFRIIAQKDFKQMSKSTNTEENSLISIINAFNAAGTFVPPFFIYNRIMMNELSKEQKNSYTMICASEFGAITEELFVEWLNHFKTFTQPSKDHQILLILDNNEWHISLSADEFCQMSFIHIVTLPPNVSHTMQRLDLTFQRPLETAYYKECATYMLKNPNVKITAFDVVQLYTNAFNQTKNIENAINFFKCTGINPVNQSKFKTNFASFIDELPSRQLFANANALSVNEDPNKYQTACSEVNPNKSDNSNTASLPISNILKSTLEFSSKVQKKTNEHSITFTSTRENEQSEKKEVKKIVSKRNRTDLRDVEINKIVTSIFNKEDLKKQNNIRNVKNFKEESREHFKNSISNEVLDEYLSGNLFQHFLCQELLSPTSNDFIICMICERWTQDNHIGGTSSRGYICDSCGKK